MIRFIFVYGTLKVGWHNARAVEKLRTSALPGSICGELYDISRGYPAAYNIDKTDKRIIGEVHAFTDIHKALTICDRIEGCSNGGTSSDNLYNRITTQCRLDTGELIECWVYEINNTERIRSMALIESGVWERGAI